MIERKKGTEGERETALERERERQREGSNETERQEKGTEIETDRENRKREKRPFHGQLGLHKSDQLLFSSESQTQFCHQIRD